MSGNFNIAQFLAEARDEGSLRSEGTFTLSAEQARKKLAKFALPSGEAWVSKLLQAVVGWKVKLLTVRQLKDVSIFHFQPSFRYGIPNGREIWDCFVSGNIGGTEPLQRFCLALHALREQEALSFLLILAERDSEPSIFADGAHLSREDAKNRNWSDLSAQPGLTLVVSHFNDHQRRLFGFLSTARGADVRRRAGIASRIQQSALGYPLALELDSRRLDKMEFRGLRQNEILAIRPIKNCHSKGDLLLPISLFEYLDNEAVSGHIRRQPHCLGLLLVCSTNVAACSRALWIDDGVVLDRREFTPTGRLGFTLLLSASGLPTDLTGLSLTASTEWDTRAREVTRQCQALAAELLKDQGRLYVLARHSDHVNRDQFVDSLRAISTSMNHLILMPEQWA